MRVLLTEAEIAHEFAEAMEARDLPEKFFYWTPLSVNAWKNLAGESHESLRPTWEALALKAGDLVKAYHLDACPSSASGQAMDRRTG